MVTFVYPLESELRRTSPPSLLELPGPDEAAVRVVPRGDRWFQMGERWVRFHAIPRDAAYTPQSADGGPDLSTVTDARISFRSCLNGLFLAITDDWRSAPVAVDSLPRMGTSTSARSGESIDVPVRVAD